MVDRLERLGHHPVVGGHDHDGDVGHPGAPGAHRRERLVARRVEEDDPAAVLDDLAGPDVLGDSAALAGRHGGRRIASSRLVLPWSTWPMTVTIGARVSSSAGVVLLEQDLLGRLGHRLLAGHRLAGLLGTTTSATS